MAAHRQMVAVDWRVRAQCLLPAYVLLLQDMQLAYVDLLTLLIDIGWIGTLILLPLCDVMLFIDAFKKAAG